MLLSHLTHFMHIGVDMTPVIKPKMNTNAKQAALPAS
jgi:hypothetical protein